MATKRLTKRQLQAAINVLVAANNRAKEARDKVHEHCEAVYGVSPGDVDNDLYIDTIDNGCGACGGMSADEFDASMRASMARMGVEMPVDKTSKV